MIETLSGAHRVSFWDLLSSVSVCVHPSPFNHSMQFMLDATQESHVAGPALSVIQCIFICTIIVQTCISGSHPSSELQHKLGDLPDGSILKCTWMPFPTFPTAFPWLWWMEGNCAPRKRSQGLTAVLPLKAIRYMLTCSSSKQFSANRACRVSVAVFSQMCSFQ